MVPRPPVTTLVIHTWKEHGKPRPWREEYQTSPTPSTSGDDHCQTRYCTPPRLHHHTSTVMSTSSTFEDLRAPAAHYMSASPITLSASSTFDDLFTFTHSSAHFSSSCLSHSFSNAHPSANVVRSDDGHWDHYVPRSSSFDTALIHVDDSEASLSFSTTTISSHGNALSDKRIAKKSSSKHKRGSSMSASLDTLSPHKTSTAASREVSLREATLLKQTAHSVSVCRGLRDMTQRQTHSVDAGLSCIATGAKKIAEEVSSPASLSCRRFDSVPVPLGRSVSPKATEFPTIQGRTFNKQAVRDRISGLALSEIDASTFAKTNVL